MPGDIQHDPPRGIFLLLDVSAFTRKQKMIPDFVGKHNVVAAFLMCCTQLINSRILKLNLSYISLLSVEFSYFILLRKKHDEPNHDYHPKPDMVQTRLCIY